MFHIQRCTAADLPALRDISRRTFRDTFGPLNTEADMAAYLDRTFDSGRLLGELENPASRFYFLYADGGLAGYLKLNEHPAQTDFHDPESLEIERIYVLRPCQGRGFGGVLMDKAVREARALGKAYLWLGVWEKNTSALRFYEQRGFYKTGEHLFALGDDLQTDYILRKDLMEASEETT